MNKLSIASLALAMAATLAAAPVSAQGGRWSSNPSNTWGYSLMTPQERTEHQAKMRSFKTYDECKAYQAEHHQQMEVRAKEKGVTLPPMGQGGYGCDNMKARGYLQ